MAEGEKAAGGAAATAADEYGGAHAYSGISEWVTEDEARRRNLLTGI